MQVHTPLLQRRLGALGYQDVDLHSESSTVSLVEKLVNDLISAGQSAREVQNGAAATQSQLAFAENKARDDAMVVDRMIENSFQTHSNCIRLQRSSFPVSDLDIYFFEKANLGVCSSLSRSTSLMRVNALRNSCKPGWKRK
jgi:hypothetical protein